jgi:cytochrome c oxidase assembly protein subunit 15
MGSVLAILHHPATLRRLAFASVIVNVIIVVTGGLVRLTDSGLGCPTWPRCTDDSYVPTSAMGIHGAIEFGNRTLISVVGGVAVAGLIVAWVQRKRLRAALRPAFLVLVGVALQGVVGGITVHLALNPYSVALHFLLSMAILVLAHTFWMRTRSQRRDSEEWTPPPALRGLAVCLTVACAAVLVLGTVVTGSGPHAGDAKAARTGFDPQAMAQLHADGVFLLIGLSVALWFAARALGAPRSVTRAALGLVVVELSQGVIGFVQYFTGLPEAVVAAHMLGACLVWLATLSTLAAVSRPLAGQQAEEQVIRPLTLDPRAGDQVSLPAEADALEQPRGADVAPVGVRREPV